MKRPRRVLVLRSKGLPGWVWLLAGVAATLIALAVLAVLAARGGASSLSLRGEYVVEGTDQWSFREKAWEQSGIWNGRKVRITASTFEGLGEVTRYELLGDGRIQVGGAIWRYSTEGSQLVLMTPDWRYTLKRH